MKCFKERKVLMLACKDWNWHYPQTLGADAKKNVVRDINPLECHVWYQSLQDYKKNMDQKDTDVPFEPEGQSGFHISQKILPIKKN